MNRMVIETFVVTFFTWSVYKTISVFALSIKIHCLQDFGVCAKSKLYVKAT